MQMSQRSFRIILVALAIIGACIDQASKYGVFRWLYDHSTHYDHDRKTGQFEIVAGWFKLYTQYTDDQATDVLRKANSAKLPRVNHGALFGLLNDHEHAANWLFASVSVVAGMGIVVWSFRTRTAHDRFLCIALGLILAGTMGNLYDRIVFGGVRDFMYFYRIDWPVFNFADCCLVVGAFVLLIQAFFPQKAPAQPGDAVTTSPVAASEVATTR